MTQRVDTHETRVILSTMGTGGDVFPFVAIGRDLAAAGHDVTIVTNACYSAEIRAAGLRAEAIDEPHECDGMIRDGALLSDGRGWVQFVDRHVTPHIQREVEILRRLVVPGRTVLMTRATPGFAARIAADSLHVPLIGVMMAPANVLGWRMYEQLVQSRIGPAVNECRRALGLTPVADWSRWLRYDQSIGLWPPWFCPIQSDDAPDRAWPPGLRLVGFLPAEDPDEGRLEEPELQALPASPPIVLIAAGTGVFGGRELFERAVEGCVLAGCRPVIVCRQSAMLPARMPEGGIAVPTVASLAALIRQVAVVCHHGGTGTIGQALAAGVPQLIMAMGGDRPDNANRVYKLGVAEVIPPTERTGPNVAAALSRLLHDSAVKRRCLEIARCMRECPALPLVRDAVPCALART